ncbi:MAG: electron transfer flavoprotein subunit alpha/FixB family protein [Dehalococcoidia bacterium]|nr:electron transfer flavoprotein subunit alpha/FixB family protein [Dehalococcoidia bacterium]
MAEQGEVMVYAQIHNGQLAGVTPELLGAGSKLAKELGVKLSAALLGSGLGQQAQELIAYGADRVYTMEGPGLEGYLADAHVTAMAQLCREVAPAILLLGHNIVGRDLAPRLACRLKTGLCTDSLELALDPATHELLCSRTIYGGNINAVFALERQPKMTTVRPKTQEATPRDDSHKGEVIPVPVAIDPSQIRDTYIGTVKEEASGVKIEDAEFVITGGRGIGGPEGFGILEEVAKLFGGAVGGTRAAVDAEWLPSERQVGLTGKIVSPNIYVAVGLSGSMQHMVGCSGSKTIVAINTDPNAPIFLKAHFGIVGDYHKVMPRFLDKCKELLKD